MLAVLRGLGLEGVEGSAEAIPFGDGVADAVVAGSSLHWFELELALPEIHRVLRPGGRFGFGWNHRDDRHPAIAAMAEAVYEAQAAHPRAALAQSRLGDRAGRAAVCSEDVERARFEHVHEIPREALRDHLLSYSGVAALSEDERQPVLSKVAALLDSDESVSGDGTLRLPFVVTAFRATRRLAAAEVRATLVEAEETEQAAVLVEHDHAPVGARRRALERLVVRGIRRDDFGVRVDIVHGAVPRRGVVRDVRDGAFESRPVGEQDHLHLRVGE